MTYTPQPLKAGQFLKFDMTTITEIMELREAINTLQSQFDRAVVSWKANEELQEEIIAKLQAKLSAIEAKEPLCDGAKIYIDSLPNQGPLKPLPDEEVLFIAESHGIDTNTCDCIGFYTDLIQTTPCPDQKDLA